MSEKETDRLVVIERVVSKQLSQQNAAEQLGLSSRQIRNLQKRYLSEGVEG